MAGPRLFSPAFVAGILAIVVAAALFVYRSGSKNASDARLVAFSASVDETRVLQALKGAGIDDAAGATNTLVPLSDFSRVVTVTFLDASRRTAGADPRRTPFLDALEGRFRVAGPGSLAWSVIYLPGPSQKRDSLTARALDGLGADWAWDAPGQRGKPWFLCLPALGWALWLVSRKPKRDRLGRVLAVLVWVPLLVRATPAAAAVFILLASASTVALRWFRFGSRRQLVRALWPYPAAALTVFSLDPGMAPFIAVSLLLIAAAFKVFRPLELAAGRKRLHEAPRFSDLTTAGPLDYGRRVFRGLGIPLVFIVAASVFLPAGGRSLRADGPAFRLERQKRGSADEPKTLLEEHLAYQTALTYGRVGDLRWGDRSYVPAYRYAEEGGRMKRIEEPAQPELVQGTSSFRTATLVLAGGAPTSVRVLTAPAVQHGP